MAESEHLQPVLFHGTDTALKPGGSVLPAKETGVRSNFPHLRAAGGKSTREQAYATSDESIAWGFADQAAYKGGGRTSVVEVEPHPDMAPGLRNPLHPRFGIHRENLEEYTAPEFKVKSVHDIRPGHQGTFSQLNWQQFAKHPNGTPYGDSYNHPSPHDVETGMGKDTEGMRKIQEQWHAERATGVQDKLAKQVEDRVQGKLF